MSLRGLPVALRDAVFARVAALEQAGFMRRLWARDTALWSDTPEAQAVAGRRLGWLDVATAMRPHLGDLVAFAAELAREGYTHAVLLGMGGSSLAPEVLRRTFGVRPGALDLTVLDSTSPDAVRAMLDTHDPGRTFVLVSSKSGGTIEVVTLEACVWEWVHAQQGERTGRSFAAITDPDTSLQELAGGRGYRRVFTNPADIGGRYSALSLFGLVPAALTGVDLTALLDHADAEMRASGPAVPAADNPALVLGAALGELAVRGRDKVTLVLGPEIAALGGWIEQLLAESTGKNGRGLVPVAGESPAPTDAYGDDRVFVALSVEPLPSVAQRALDAIHSAGQPVLAERLSSRASIGGQFLRWEIATAVAGAVLGVDPFDEPNVTEAKEATKTVLDRAEREGRLPARDAVATREGLRAETPRAIAERLRSLVADAADPVAWAAALAALAQPGDYFAILAYLRETPGVDARLQRIRDAVRASQAIATTSGYGPRFLHSTGQLHKGGPNTGVFLQLTADHRFDVAIPGRPFGFATLIDAQAWGDFHVLEQRGRRVLRLHLGADPERVLDSLAAAIARAGRPAATR